MPKKNDTVFEGMSIPSIDEQKGRTILKPPSFGDKDNQKKEEEEKKKKEEEEKRKKNDPKIVSDLEKKIKSRAEVFKLEKNRDAKKEKLQREMFRSIKENMKLNDKRDRWNKKVTVTQRLSGPKKHEIAGKKKKIKFYYLDQAFWRGECVRLAFYIGNVPYEDVRISEPIEQYEQLPAEHSTFGQMPILEITDYDGDDDDNDDEGDNKKNKSVRILSTSTAIINYAAKLSGLVPQILKDDKDDDIEDDKELNDWLLAKMDELINGCELLTQDVMTQKFMQSTDQEKYELFAVEGGYFRMLMGGMEKLILQNDHPFGCSCGERLTIADLAIWRCYGSIATGALGIPSQWFEETFPAIHKLIKAVDCHPKVEEYKQMNKKYYYPDQYDSDDDNQDNNNKKDDDETVQTGNH